MTPNTGLTAFNMTTPIATDVCADDRFRPGHVKASPLPAPSPFTQDGNNTTS
jgi:hypothetical protein